MAESKEMTVGRFITAANEVTIGGFWREHAKGELRTREDHEVLKFLSPCREKRYMARMFYAKKKIHIRGLCARAIEYADELVSTRDAESTNELYSTLWESKRSRVGSVQLPKATVM